MNVATRRKGMSTGIELAVCFGLAGALLFFPVLVTAHGGMLRRLDFGAFYASGLILRQGHGAKLYDVQEQQRVQQQLLSRPGVLANPYPPFQAILFAPLTLLSYRAAYVTFGVINVLLWLYCVWLLRKCGSWEEHPLRLLLLGSLFFPLWMALFHGQFSVILLFSFTLSFAYLKNNRDYAAGLGSGLGLIKFVVVVPFALILVFRRKWRFAGGLLTAAAGWMLMSFTFVGTSGMRRYAGLLAGMFKNPSDPGYSVPIILRHMPTTRAFLTEFLGTAMPQHWISALWVLASGSLLLIVAWQWNQSARSRAESKLDLAFAAAVAVSLVTAPHLYPYDLTPMMLAAALVLSSPCVRANSIASSTIRAATVILYASPLYLFDERGLQAVFLLAPVLVGFALAALSLTRQTTIDEMAGSQGGSSDVPTAGAEATKPVIAAS